jgi:hypothetical protein
VYWPKHLTDSVTSCSRPAAAAAVGTGAALQREIRLTPEKPHPRQGNCGLWDVNTAVLSKKQHFDFCIFYFVHFDFCGLYTHSQGPMKTTPVSS